MSDSTTPTELAVREFTSRLGTMLAKANPADVQQLFEASAVAAQRPTNNNNHNNNNTRPPTVGQP